MTSTPRRKVHSHRFGAVCVVVLVVVGWVAVGSSIAHADSGAALTVSPVSGTVDDTLTLITSAGCPEGSNASVARIVGPGFPKRGQNLTGILMGFTAPGRAFPVETAYTLRDTAALAYPPVTYKGTYRVEVLCRNLDVAEPLSVFTTSIRFATPTTWTVVGGSAANEQQPSTRGQAATTPTPSSSGGPTSGQATLAPQDTSTQPATNGSGAQASSSASPAQSLNASDATAANSGSASGTAAEGESAADVAAPPARESVGQASSSPSASSSVVPAVLGALVGALAVAIGVALVRRPRSTGRRDAR